MRTATGLILIAIGAILTFAVTASTPGFNLHVAGLVIILVGLAGLFIRRQDYASISRRFITRRSRSGPKGTVVETEEAQLPPYVVRNPGTSREQAGLPTSMFPSIPVDRGVQERAVGPDRGMVGPQETEIVEHIDE